MSIGSIRNLTTARITGTVPVNRITPEIPQITGHEHRIGWRGAVSSVLRPHSHDATDSIDSALEASADGMRTLKISLVALAGTAAVQAAIVVTSGSVALLADTIHNVADALTAVPLVAAFWLGRRPANHRYTHGYGRSEDLAGTSSCSRSRRPLCSPDGWRSSGSSIPTTSGTSDG